MEGKADTTCRQPSGKPQTMLLLQHCPQIGQALQVWFLPGQAHGRKLGLVPT